MDEETTTMAPQAEKPAPSRRKFLTGAAATAAGATAALAAPNVSRAQTTTIKMQGAWAPQDILNEFAEDYVTRVNEMGGDRLQIDYLISGSVVKPFSIHDAVHQGVLQGGHTVPAYVYGKNKAASLFGTGPAFGWNAHQFLAWINFGGGAELYQELMQRDPRLQHRELLLDADADPAARLVQERDHGADDLKGMKFRTVGLATEVFQNMGVAVTQLPGGEIVPAMQQGVIDGFEFNNPSSDRLLGAPDVAKNYMLGSYHQANEFFEIIFNKDIYDGLARRAAGAPEIRERGGVLGHPVEGVRPLLERPDRLAGGGRRHGLQDPSRRHAGAARGLGQGHRAALGRRLLQAGDRIAEGLGQAGRVLRPLQQRRL